MSRFQPGKILTALTLLALAILIALGTWQGLKIGPKSSLLDRLNVGLNEPSAELPVDISEPEAFEYRRFSFNATPVNADPVKVFGTDKRGKAGYHLYQPVRHPNGKWIIVNWGWIPAFEEDLPPLPATGVTTRIDGVLLTNPSRGSFTPVNNAARGEWYIADIFEIAEHFGLEDFYQFRIVADHRRGLGEYPIGGQVRIDIPNDHFEYMLTWYGLALGLLGVYGFFGFRRAIEQNDS